MTKSYICDFCPNEIKSEDDGFVVFSSISLVTSRGLLSKIGDLPTDQHTYGRHKTHICRPCFKKKLNL